MISLRTCAKEFLRLSAGRILQLIIDSPWFPHQAASAPLQSSLCPRCTHILGSKLQLTVVGLNMHQFQSVFRNHKPGTEIQLSPAGLAAQSHGDDTCKHCQRCHRMEGNHLADVQQGHSGRTCLAPPQREKIKTLTRRIIEVSKLDLE